MIPQDFTFLSHLIKLRSGFVLGSEKLYLVDSHLLPVARSNGFESIADLMRALRRGAEEALLCQVTEAMTVEDSVFFRDRAPFEALARTIVPELVREAAAPGLLRVWSAGCATGQEAYSIAMRLFEMREALAGWCFEIVATDLSGEALSRASAGQYTQFEVQRGLPIALLVRYFRKSGWSWNVDDAVRATVRFRQANLLEDCAALGSFDIVFCRYVLLYLDTADRRKVLANIARRMNPGGFLVLGTTETAHGAAEAFEPVAGARGIFRRAGRQEMRQPARAGARPAALPA